MAGKYRPGAFTEAGDLRVDRSDGESYSRDDFISCYGGTVEWHAAKVDLEVLEGALEIMPDFAEALDAFVEGHIDAHTFYFQLREAFGKQVAPLLDSLERTASLSPCDFTRLAAAVRDVAKRTQRLAATLIDIAGEAAVKDFRTQAVAQYNAAPAELPAPLCELVEAQAAGDSLKVPTPSAFPTASARRFHAALVSTFGDSEGVFEDVTATLPSLKKQGVLRFARRFAATHEGLAELCGAQSLPTFVEYVYDAAAGGADPRHPAVRLYCTEVLDAVGARGVEHAVQLVRDGGDDAAADALAGMFQELKQERSGSLIVRLTELAGAGKLGDFRKQAMREYVKADESSPEGLRAAARTFVASLTALVGPDNLSVDIVKDMALLLPSEAKQDALLAEAGATPAGAGGGDASVTVPEPLLSLITSDSASVDAFYTAHIRQYQQLTKAAELPDAALELATSLSDILGDALTAGVVDQIIAVWLSSAQDTAHDVKARRLRAAYSTLRIAQDVEAAWVARPRTGATPPNQKTIVKKLAHTYYKHALLTESERVKPDTVAENAMGLWNVLTKIMPGGALDAAELTCSAEFKMTVADEVLVDVLVAAAHDAMAAALAAREKEAAEEDAKEAKRLQQREEQDLAQRAALERKEEKQRAAVSTEEEHGWEKMGRNEAMQRNMVVHREDKAAREAAQRVADEEERERRREEKERRKRAHEEKEQQARERRVQEQQQRAEEQRRREEEAYAVKAAQLQEEEERAAKLEQDREEARLRLRQQREAELARKEEERKEHERQLEQEKKKAARDAKKSRKEREAEEKEREEAALRRQLQEGMAARDAEVKRRESNHKQQQQQIQKNRDRKQNMNVMTGGGSCDPSPAHSPAHAGKNSSSSSKAADWPHMTQFFWAKEPKCPGCNVPLNGQACRRCP